MSEPTSSLAYEHRPTCGTVAVHRDGPQVCVVVEPEPVHWRTVVRRTVYAAAAAALLGVAISAPRTAPSFIIFALAGRWVYLTVRRRQRRPRVGWRGTQFVAGPDGLKWIRPAAGQDWTFPAADIARVRLHLSPWSARRTHPISVVLVLSNGDCHALGQGTLDEATLIADSIEDGLGLATDAERTTADGVSD